VIAASVTNTAQKPAAFLKSSPIGTRRLNEPALNKQIQCRCDGDHDDAIVKLLPSVGRVAKKDRPKKMIGQWQR